MVVCNQFINNFFFKVLVKLGKSSPLQKASKSLKEIVNAGHDANTKLNLFGKLTKEQTSVYEAVVRKGMNVFDWF